MGRTGKPQAPKPPADAGGDPAAFAPEAIGLYKYVAPSLAALTGGTMDADIAVVTPRAGAARAPHAANRVRRVTFLSKA